MHSESVVQDSSALPPASDAFVSGEEASTEASAAAESSCAALLGDDASVTAGGSSGRGVVDGASLERESQPAARPIAKTMNGHRRILTSEKRS